MSTTPGYFDETILQDIRVKAAEIAFDDRLKKRFIPHIKVLDVIQQLQTARVEPLPLKYKEADLEVTWLNVCGNEVEEDENCELGGEEASSNLETYSISWNRAYKFSVDEVQFIDNDYDRDEAVAIQFLNADKALSEAFAQYAVGRLEAFKGVNCVTDPATYTVSGHDTFIPPAYWDADLIAYMQRVSVMNQFTDPVILSGVNLYDPAIIAAFNAGNADGKGDSMKYDALDIQWDLWNIESVNGTENKRTYLISQGAMAMGSRNYAPPEYDDVKNTFVRYRLPSNHTPFVYDVYYSAECSSRKNLIKHNFKLVLHADIFNNPTTCLDCGGETNTGILAFTCGSGS